MSLKWYKINILLEDTNIFNGYVSLENNIATSLYDIQDIDCKYNLLKDNTNNNNNNNYNNNYNNNFNNKYNNNYNNNYNNVLEIPVNDILNYYMFDSIIFNNSNIINTSQDDTYYIPILITLNETSPLITKPSFCPIVNFNNNAKKFPKSLLYSKILQQNLGKKSSNKINFAKLNINPFGFVNGMPGIKAPLKNIF